MSSPSQFLIGSVRICSSRSFFFRTSWHWAWKNSVAFQRGSATVTLSPEVCASYSEVLEGVHAGVQVGSVEVLVLKRRHKSKGRKDFDETKRTTCFV